MQTIWADEQMIHNQHNDDVSTQRYGYISNQQSRETVVGTSASITVSQAAR